MRQGLNIGSGQRRFETVPGVIEWMNVDVVSRPPDQVPDVICDVGKEALPFDNRSVDYCVLHQVYEHFGLGEAHGLVLECMRVLRLGGSLIITVPDIRRLAERWLTRQIDDYVFMVNVYGAYQGHDGDRHKFGYTLESLISDLSKCVPKELVKPFDWRVIPGADIARDWYIAGVEIVK